MNIEINNIILKNGWLDNWFFPTKDKNMYSYLETRKDDPFIYSKYCKTKNSVIQAGGNIGYYPKIYSEFFKNVYTFEPDLINFNCLTLNTINCLNIFKYQAGLGKERRPFNLLHDNDSCGSHRMYDAVFDQQEGFDRNFDGNIPILKIDDLGLKDVSLINLDVEGQEMDCLIGGLETIKLCNPVIILEVVFRNCYDFLQTLGYTKIGELNEDWIFGFKE